METDAGLVHYVCPVGCGCKWRDNGDGTMSLYDDRQQSCSICEFLPLAKLKKIRTAEAAPDERAEYSLELEEPRCESCGKGEGWTIVDSEGVGNGVTYYDKDGAQEICDDLNAAFARGRISMIGNLGLSESP